jgi:hypothetical protein
LRQLSTKATQIEIDVAGTGPAIVETRRLPAARRHRSGIPVSEINPQHPDHEVLSSIAAEIHERAPNLCLLFPELVLDALEFVLDPVRTGRTKLSDLDNVEKTFVGLKIEHYLRDLLEAPKGIRDLFLAGKNVDVKNTVSERWSWMIPPETYRSSEPCVLVALNAVRREASLGLIVARREYLRRGKNRDGKLGISASSHRHILWLVRQGPLPADRWAGLDMTRFLELRRAKGGSFRAATFFAENLNRPVHRSVIQALLHDQLDYMKRVRGNGGAKDILREKNIALLSGAFHNPALERLGANKIGKDEHIAVKLRNADDEAVVRESEQQFVRTTASAIGPMLDTPFSSEPLGHPRPEQRQRFQMRSNQGLV